MTPIMTPPVPPFFAPAVVLDYPVLKPNVPARFLPPLTLGVWGGLLIYFYATRRLAALVHPDFHALVLATGCLLVGAAACLLFAPRAGQAACHGGEPAGLNPARALGYAVLLLPVLLAAWISPDQYGHGMVRNRETAEAPASPALTLAARSPLPPPPTATAAEPVEIGDLLMAAQTPQGRERYEGRCVEFIGQINPLGPGRFELVRMLMLCCAADAQILAVPIRGACALDAMKWGQVRGPVHFIPKGSGWQPEVVAEALAEIPAPADRYVYRGGTLPAPVHQGSFNLALPPR